MASRPKRSSGRRDYLAAQRGISLREYLASSGGPSTLDGGERQQVLDVLIEVIGGAYAHLPAKRAAYAVDPVQALSLLRRRSGEMTDADFHLAVTGIVTGLRDAHTRYIGPSSLRGQVAALPFLVEQFGPFDDPSFLVTNTADDVAAIDPGFQPGVTLEWWNGMPMARAVEVYADRETGGRPDSRRARALETLTFRALQYGPPPDEQWVQLGYRTKRGRAGEVRFDWRLLQPEQAGTAVGSASRAALKVAADPAAEAVRRTKKLLFAGEVWASEPVAAVTPVPTAVRKLRVKETAETPMQDVLLAKRISRDIGYLRVWSFDVEDDDAFLDEVARLLDMLPTGGVIVDLRGNPGGLVWAAERMLQLFTDDPDNTPIRPTRFSLLASHLTRDMASSPFNRLELEAWSPSLEDAISTGELHAQPLPLTDPAWCNDLGRRYPGPAVAVVDANTYSSGDLFAAGWVDHEIGPLVTVGQATGGGGANVWTSGQLRDALGGTDHALGPLPEDVGFTLAIRRTIRSGRGDGIPIEDLGISGIPYAMTEDDLLHSNPDLIDFCTSLLTTP